MKHLLIIAISLCILMLAALLFLRSPVTDIDLSGYEKAIRQHLERIAAIEHERDRLRHERDSLLQVKQEVQIIREYITVEVEQLPPTELLATWDSETGPHAPTTLTPDSLAITPLPRIRKGTIALKENPLLKQEIQLHETLNQNLTQSLTLCDSAHLHKDNIIAVQDTIIHQQANDITRYQKREKWWKRGIFAVAVYAAAKTIF